MTAAKPTATVGRIVLFTDDAVRGFPAVLGQDDEGKEIVVRAAVPGKEQPYPAQITHVNDDGTVNLEVAGDAVWPRNIAGAEPCRKTEANVRLLQPGEARPTSGKFCEWMPYQVGQAAKNDGEVAELRKQVEALRSQVQTLASQQGAVGG